MTLHLKRCIPDSQRYPSNLYLINNVEDIIIFLNSLLKVHFLQCYCIINRKVTLKVNFKVKK